MRRAVRAGKSTEEVRTMAQARLIAYVALRDKDKLTYDKLVNIRENWFYLVEMLDGDKRRASEMIVEQTAIQAIERLIDLGIALPEDADNDFNDYVNSYCDRVIELVGNASMIGD